jgi:ketosteroid isomerase-like protein
MSEENVRLFLESSEAANRGDTNKWLEAFDPACVFEPQVAVLDGTFEGHVGLRAFSQTFEDIYEVFEVRFDDVRDLGDRVLALGTGIGVGKGSGIRQEQPLAIVARFRNGRITHFKDFGDKTRPSKLQGCLSSA